MTTAITTQTQPPDGPFLTPADIQLIRQQIAKQATDPEFDHFIKMATLRRLNPLVNQIALVIRNANRDNRAAVIQTTIHGLRLIADRTKRYAPGRAATYAYDNQGNLLSATAYVMKYHVASKTWHEVSDTAFFAEYVQTYWDDKNKVREISGLWKTHPHVMLAKCAEALALRRAFPEDTSGLYTDDEMGQADNAPTYTVHNPSTGEIIDSRSNRARLDAEYKRLYAKAIDLGIPVVKDSITLPPAMPTRATDAQVVSATEYLHNLIVQGEQMTDPQPA